MASDATVRAEAWVARMTPEARGLGAALVELIDDPDAFARTLEEGFRRLADPAYAAEQERVAPGSGEVIGVRWPLVRAVARQLQGPLREGSAASALWLAERLAMSPIREIRLFSHVPLERSLPADPERSWQLIRRLAHRADDWISTDSLAGLMAQGILAEPRRWAELEQLVYSPHRFERRLVGATLATMPFRVPRSARRQLPAERALAVIRSLIGDADEQVQKALSWAVRSWNDVDAVAVTRLLLGEADTAARTRDGHRAWVVRNALTTQPRAIADDVRRALGSVRRQADAPSTSIASEIAASFAALSGTADRIVERQGERMAGRA